MASEAGRHWETGALVVVRIEGGSIAAVDAWEDPSPEIWVAPAFRDIQVNGRWGISFSDPGLTVEQVARIVRAQAEIGTSDLCPTLISAGEGETRHGVETIAKACDSDPEIAARVLGIHLEGPYLSEVDGYRGAHPVGAIRDPAWDEFQGWQEAAGGRIVLVTIAPERPGAIEFIEKAVTSGVVVALGHTSANGPTIRAAVDAGASLSTHLGNGIATPLARHPNPIFEQAAEDRLMASLIADGHHLDPSTLRVLARSKGADRLILVSDASPFAGSPPGDYGPWSVLPSGKIVVSGTDYLAGSSVGLPGAVANLRAAAGFSTTEAIATVTRNPARLLGLPEPRIAPGEPADLVLFTLEGGFRLVATCVGGRWVEPAETGA